jgi:hypothetical protein
LRGFGGGALLSAPSCSHWFGKPFWPLSRASISIASASERFSAPVGSAPAVMNAVVDVLCAFRIRHVDMPATPERLWAAIREGKRVHTM